ncbi:MAG: argininosuccinate lyase, partial [Methanomassiliicoccaceae archaeon]|nr:argininosuccinate lyase [Methanomassiliicoccaceae archaeon]
TNATDAADWLVRKGVAFREAHEIVGKLVLLAIDRNVRLDELTVADLRTVSDVFDDSFYDAVSVEACVSARNIEGGPSEAAVAKAVKKAERYLRSLQ